MTSSWQVLCVGGVYFLIIIAVLEIGYRVGASHRRTALEATEGTGAVEATVLGLVGLILAFSFSASQQRLNDRRELIVRESNAIGTAYLRLDLLPAADQPPLRAMFRKYVDIRLQTFQNAHDSSALTTRLTAAAVLQRDIWERALASARASGSVPSVMLLVPALNEMIDVTTNRTVALSTHAPAVVAVLLAFLGLCAALLCGYAMSRRPFHSPLHMVIFSLAIAATVYVVVDLDYPRAGLIRVASVDRAMADLKVLMQK